MDRIHLNMMLMNNPVTHKMGGWADEGDEHFASMGDLKAWAATARKLERGLFDSIFFADTPAPSDGYEGGQEAAIRYAVNWPSHDPMPLIAAMAAATDHLGFAVTLSTTGNHPYLAVRRLSTLDYVSQGRIGWNIVTGHNRAEGRAVASPVLPHDERYDAADEFMDVCYALWQSIGPEALVLDRERRIFGDPSQVARVEYSGKYYQCSAYGAVLPSAQGRPVIFQAGASGRGMQFAARHAEGLFAVQSHLDGMQRYAQQIRAAYAAQGRDPATARVMFGIQPVIASTEAEARALARQMREEVPLEAGLARLSGSLGLDFGQFDPDARFTELKNEGSQGMMAAFAMPVNGVVPTVRDVAINFGLSVGMMRVIGTPDQVATQIEDLWRQSGCHGFNISPARIPSSIDEFVDTVVPILQQRGVYHDRYPGRTFRENLLG